MYKLLLSWRYLRTRFIALASIISVTLGVATLIVVNSVMSGFVDQMKSRLHGILSDVEISAPLLGQINYPEEFVEQVKQVVGDDLEALTCIVRTPGMLTAKFNDHPVTQQVVLMGIDDDSFGKVSDFRPFLQNERKRDKFSFALESSGYSEPFDPNAWEHRRRVYELEKFKAQLNSGYGEMYDEVATQYRDLPLPTGNPADASHSEPNTTPGKDAATVLAGFPELPEFAPPIPGSGSDQADLLTEQPTSAEPQLAAAGTEEKQLPSVLRISPFDPHSRYRPQITPEEMFDPMKDQYTGIILGIGLGKRKIIDENEKISDFYTIRPGDDVQIMIPTIGAHAQAVMDKCTVVDFYSSNMHEYDSMFAFMPISALQKLRGMIDPMTGVASVSTIQIKLKPGVNIEQVRDRLMVAFPIEMFGYDIHTWLDTQAPLLSAVQMELTVLNILLFLIIAVAGFGILATFYMIVVEKTKDIGILKALGAPAHGIMSIFLGYGLSLGLVGTGAGIVLGLLFARNINEIADLIEFFTGHEVFDPTVYYFSEIPVLIGPTMVFWVSFGAVLIAVLASVLPALRAARLHPVEALRYE
jgi:lipoprotein-releasing system permease protein